MPQQADLLYEHQRLDGQAKEHKRAISQHRQALKNCRERQAKLEQQLAALGIKHERRRP